MENARKTDSCSLLSATTGKNGTAKTFFTGRIVSLTTEGETLLTCSFAYRCPHHASKRICRLADCRSAGVTNKKHPQITRFLSIMEHQQPPVPCHTRDCEKDRCCLLSKPDKLQLCIQLQTSPFQSLLKGEPSTCGTAACTGLE